VCVEIGVARLAEVMSAGVGAVSVRPLELCLWVGLVEVPAATRGRGAGCGRMAGAALVEAGSPTPAANAERVSHELQAKNCRRYVSAGKVDWQCMDQSELSFEVSHPQPIAGVRRRPPHTLRADTGEPATASGADMTSRIVFDDEFPQAIRVRGLTLSEVALRARLSVATVSSAVRGRPVNITTAVRLAKVVSASPIIPELDEWARAPDSQAVDRRTRHAVNRSAAE
jgi:hypothetical protein